MPPIFPGVPGAIGVSVCDWLRAILLFSRATQPNVAACKSFRSRTALPYGPDRLTLTTKFVLLRSVISRAAQPNAIADKPSRSRTGATGTSPICLIPIAKCGLLRSVYLECAAEPSVLTMRSFTLLLHVAPRFEDGLRRASLVTKWWCVFSRSDWQ